jgi:carboxyl-terminal processing protease
MLMFSDVTRAAVLAILALGCTSANRLAVAQDRLQNPDFEIADQDLAPASWSIGRVARDRGYIAALSDEAYSGSTSAKLIYRGYGASPDGFGALVQRIPANGYRGRVIRFSAVAKADVPTESSAGLWLRVDRPDRQIGFFDNMSDHPIRSEGWTPHEIIGPVASDATYISVGLLLNGAGQAWIDTGSLEVVADGNARSAEADAYLDRAMTLLRQNHINSLRADWVSLEELARVRSQGAVTPAQTHEALREVLRALQEPHSSLVEAEDSGKVAREAVLLPTFEILPGPLGLLRLPAHQGRSADEDASYVRTGWGALAAFQRSRVCGVLIDLRSNTGGDMWPMLNAMAPLLGDEPVGGFSTVAPTAVPWLKRGGLFTAPGEDRTETSASPPGPFNWPVALAILVNRETASAGEMAAIAARSVPGSLMFGSMTAGLTSANRPVVLSDGALLNITEASVLDHTGRLISGGLEPDVSVPDSETLHTASEWATARACGGASAETR